MSKLPSVAIDPYLLIFPEPCHSADQLMNFIDGLLNWSETLSRLDTEYFISELCVESLMLDGWYPYSGRIERLIQKFGLTDADNIDFVDENTLITLAQKVLDKTPRLEEHVGIEIILYDEESVCVEPIAVIDRLGENTSFALKQSFAILGLGLTHLTTMPNGCVFASADGNECVNLSEVSFEVTVDEVAFFDPPPQQILFPLSYSETFHVCLGHADYIKQVSVLELWGYGDSEQHILDAIVARAMEHRETGVPTSGTLPSYSAGLVAERNLYQFRLGSQFLASVQKWGFGNRQDWAMLLIDTCARILLSIPKNEINPFRISAHSGEQRERSSDGALAWRTHLTKANAGFRLLLWTTPDGVIEFANIGPKKELIIEE